jgi:hypothetical protein
LGPLRAWCWWFQWARMMYFGIKKYVSSYIGKVALYFSLSGSTNVRATLVWQPRFQKRMEAFCFVCICVVIMLSPLPIVRHEQIKFPKS